MGVGQKVSLIIPGTIFKTCTRKLNAL